jgi:hypothetical protein
MKMLVATFLVKHYGLGLTGGSQKGKRGISWKWREQVYTKVISKINREDIRAFPSICIYISLIMIQAKLAILYDDQIKYISRKPNLKNGKFSILSKFK